MDSGVLPRIDRQLLLYQCWLTERLATIEDPEHHGRYSAIRDWNLGNVHRRDLRPAPPEEALGHQPLDARDR